MYVLLFVTPLFDFPVIKMIRMGQKHFNETAFVFS